MELLGSFLFVGDGFFTSFTCTGVVFGGLSTNGKSVTMANTAITTYVHQTFDVQLDFAAKVTFDFVVVADDFAHSRCLIVGPVFYLDVYIHTGFLENFLCRAAADTKNLSQCYFTSFVLGEINSHDSYCHVLALTVVKCE